MELLNATAIQSFKGWICIGLSVYGFFYVAMELLEILKNRKKGARR